MFSFENIQPGSWANITMSQGYGFKGQNYENNPVFVMTNELSGINRTVMLLDKKFNTLVWYEDIHNRHTPFGRIYIHSIPKEMKDFTSIKKEDIDSETMASMIKKAEEERQKFLGNAPEMKKFFFS